MSDNHELHHRVKKMIVESLRLKVTPEQIADDAPLFPTLGLDSIDGLEMPVAIERVLEVSQLLIQRALGIFRALAIRLPVTRDCPRCSAQRANLGISAGSC